MAEAYYAAVAPHNPLGPISLAAGVQLSASIPNFLCQEQVSLGEGYIKQPFKVREGYLELPTGPGLGIELDENALADKIGHDWRNPQSYDADDGSVLSTGRQKGARLRDGSQAALSEDLLGGGERIAAENAHVVRALEGGGVRHLA